MLSGYTDTASRGHLEATAPSGPPRHLPGHAEGPGRSSLGHWAGDLGGQERDHEVLR